MIGVIFQYGAETIEARINGGNIMFRTSSFGKGFVPIDNLHFDKSGVIKEFPDLENDSNWRLKAIERFKKELSNKTEKQIADYLIADLSKYGYKPKYRQIQGHRVEVLDAHN